MIFVCILQHIFTFIFAAQRQKMLRYQFFALIIFNERVEIQNQLQKGKKEQRLL